MSLAQYPQRLACLAVAVSLGILCACSAQSVAQSADSRATPRELAEDTAQAPDTTADTRTYSFLLMKIGDNDLYAEYRRNTLPALKSLDIRIEREFQVVAPPSGQGVDVGAPDRGMLLSYPDQKTAQALASHPQYFPHIPLRDQAISEFYAISGTTLGHEISESPVADRLYLLKLSYFEREREGRLEDLKRVGRKLAPYGFHTERRLAPTSARNLEVPSELSLHFHDIASQNEQLHGDKDAMKSIAEYNRNYVTRFVYVPLRVIE